ncbi:EF-hand domain-containing protein [Labrenzia aggregata]|uniref:EF-hand domain-containing protein n=2 Tax=Roseibium aggregatum TaxID=187304 RepID=A0A926P3J9_9HYPH|nr:EF-hand domain-containing protein [Roseibium aggregatum]
MMTDQDNNQARPMPGYGYGRRGNMPWGYHGHMGPGMMYGRGGGYGMGPGMMGSGMMGNGMMGRGMMGPQMMILMMDTNGDGKLSLEEFQAIHGRMFKYLDKNGDGQLTPDEIRKNWQDDDDGDEGGDAK